MNYLANKPFRFVANRYEEWFNGSCISQGPITAEISASVEQNGLHFEIIGANDLRMHKQGTFALINERGMSADMGIRLQYLNPVFSEGDPLDLILCHVFYEGRTITYIRFAMSFPDRIIEFYGKLKSFNGFDRPDGMTEGHIPPMKKYFIDVIAEQYRTILKENTVNPAIIDHQMACVAFSLKMYYSLLAMENDEQGNMKDQVFKDTSSIISQFFPIFQNEALDDARNWFRQIASNPYHADVFIDYYYGNLSSGRPIDYSEILRAFNLN